MTAEQPIALRGILGDADRCCPAGLCVYRPSMVAFYLSVMRHLAEAGEDVAEAAESALARRGEGRTSEVSPGSGQVRYATRIWDVQMALATLGSNASVVQIACRLCPFGLDDELSTAVE